MATMGAVVMLIRAIEQFTAQIGRATLANAALFAAWYAWRHREEQRLLSVLRAVLAQREEAEP